MGYPTREAVRRYCVANDLFTSGTTAQFEKMLNMVDLRQPIANIATVIWVCSDTDKHAADIEKDLLALTRKPYEPAEMEIIGTKEGKEYGKT